MMGVRVVFRSCVSIRIEQRICLNSHVQILIILTKLNSRAAHNVFCMLAMPLRHRLPPHSVTQIYVKLVKTIKLNKKSKHCRQISCIF